MKKALLACSIILGSVFFVSAQFQVGDVRVNVGKVCGTIRGKPACMNPSTGEWVASTGDGNTIGGNVNTGVVGGTGSIGGVKFGGVLGLGGSGVAGSQNFSGPLGILLLAQVLVAKAIPFLVSLALLAFFWFLVEFIWKGKDSPDEQAKGKKGMFYSIVAIFVMVSIWGIIAFMGQILGVGQGGGMQGFKLPGEQ